MNTQIPGVALALVVASTVYMSTSCAPGSKDMTQQSRNHETVTGASPAATPNNVKRPTVLFIGTSLTAGYGLQPEQAYPVLVARLADSAGLPIKAVNAGVSGETSADLLQRIDWVLRTPADIVQIETGANDALRGLSVAAARANIQAIVDTVRKAKPDTPILLVQMEAPPNYGISYTKQFHDMYPEIAQANGLVLVPFLLNGVAGNPQLNQADGMHPNAVGERIVAANIWRALETVVRSFEVDSSLKGRGLGR